MKHYTRLYNVSSFMKKILLVDDDPLILDIYSSRLKKEGYVVEIANTEEKALEKITNNHPDLLVLDLNLGVTEGPKDGLRIIKLTRQNPKNKNLKIIVASNYREEDYPELSNVKNMGVIKSLVKAEITPQELAEIVKEILV